ncbi:hypothetical protein PUN28_002016 [Cardiocondyla obscurior]|uniref:Uncharacterized protein n=1 Tax=Cardiocondyla obscurior TaxID=286306 RepID=A0AAW2GSA1_9HYME
MATVTDKLYMHLNEPDLKRSGHPTKTLNSETVSNVTILPNKTEKSELLGWERKRNWWVTEREEEAAVERLFPEVSIAISIARLVFPLQWRAPSP